MVCSAILNLSPPSHLCLPCFSPSHKVHTQALDAVFYDLESSAIESCQRHTDTVTTPKLCMIDLMTLGIFKCLPHSRCSIKIHFLLSFLPFPFPGEEGRENRNQQKRQISSKIAFISVKTLRRFKTTSHYLPCVCGM